MACSNAADAATARADQALKPPANKMETAYNKAGHAIQNVLIGHARN